MSATVVTPTGSARLRRTRPIMGIIVVALTAFALFLLIPDDGSSNRPFSIHNPRPAGAQAYGRLMENQGLTIEETTSASEALAMVRAHEDKDSTLVIIGPELLSESVDREIAKIRRVVAFGVPLYSEQRTFPGVHLGFTDISSGSVDAGQTTSQTASIARTVSVMGSHDALAVDSGSWVTAFPVSNAEDLSDSLEDPEMSSGDEGDALWGTYVMAEKVEGDTYRALLSSAGYMSNQALGLHGNAALVMNIVTAHATTPVADRGPIVILHATLGDDLDERATPSPEWAVLVAVLVLIAIILWGISRGQRLGRFVFEEVPSYIPSAETVSGKGRLLLRHGQVAHIAAQMRRDTARRLARQLAIPASHSPEALANALVAAGATPESVAWLWEPIPATEADLREVADRLTALEKEISS